jgi:hypothetical protein
MISFSAQERGEHRLVLNEYGMHRFGGPPGHRGTVPPNTNVSLHHFLSIDLSDPNCPFEADAPVRFLPLYYPLKYGEGGPEVQYAVLSDTEIKLLYMSDEKPDDEDRQYVKVSVLPESQAEIIPLKYEEARILTFVGGFYRPNDEDRAILDRIDYNNYTSIGGRPWRHRHPNRGTIICRNPDCKGFNKPARTDSISIIPPISVNGSDEFWYQYNGLLDFHCDLCCNCGTVIAFNVAS